MKDLKSAKDILIEWAQKLEERAMRKKTTASEQRIHDLEERALSLRYEDRAQELIVETLCEIARQLARIGDIYEFKLGDLYKALERARGILQECADDTIGTPTEGFFRDEVAKCDAARILDDYEPKLRIKHQGSHPLTETTCDDPRCWCHTDPTTHAEIFRPEKHKQP